MDVANFKDLNTIKDFKIIEQLGGFSSDNYIASIDGQKVFLKIYKNKKLSEIENLEQIATELAIHNLPIVTPLMYEKYSKFAIDGQQASIFPLIDGKSLHGSQIVQNLFKEITEVINRFNDIKGIQGIKQTSCDLYGNKVERIKNIDSMLQYIKNNPLGDDIDQKATELLHLKKQIISEINIDDFTYFISKKDLVHGDFHNENLLFKDQKLVGLVDFELSHLGHRMEDAINFILFAFCNNDFSDDNLSISKEFIKEFHKVYPFDISELKFGVDFNIYRFASSVVLEDILYKEKNMFFYELIKRDLNKFKYFKNHKKEFIKSIY